MEKKDSTVGKAAYDLLVKVEEQHNPIEYEREMHKEYEKEVWVCVDTNKSVFDGDFYVVVLCKRERLLPNIYRNYFLARRSCPTPTFDQTVYKYHREHNALEFLWVIPDQETCVVFKREALDIAPEEKELLKFVLDFSDGTLDKKAAALNNESIKIKDR